MPYAPQAHSLPRSAVIRRDDRLSASQRGYDSRWAKLRAYHVSANPLCEDCLPILAPVHEVDHVVPINGPNDPLMLDAGNLRSLCRRHHAIKTQRDAAIRSAYDRRMSATGDQETAMRETVAEARRMACREPGGGI